MNCLKTLSIFVVVLLLPALPTTADDTTPSEAQKPPGWFSKLDLNGNGSLDRQEAGRLLGATDANQDGEVTVAEALAYVKRRQQNAARKGKRTGRLQLSRAEDMATREKTDNGLWVVSIGHSCVIPAIEPCIAIARSAGYGNHTHLIQYAGGAGGAAKAQWMRPEDKQEAKPALKTEKIDVMTFGHLVAADGKSYGCDVEDYERWIEFALKHNPDIRFFIQDLWPWLPGAGRSVKFEDFNLEEYEAAMKVSSQSVAEVVEKLNQKYPGRVHVLPVGPAMTELVRRVTRKEQPGVDAVLVPPKEKKDRVGLYRDKIHPTTLIATLEGYIYYACLYGKSPANLEGKIYRDEKLDRVLREVAWNIVIQHPLSGVKK